MIVTARRFKEWYVSLHRHPGISALRTIIADVWNTKALTDKAATPLECQKCLRPLLSHVSRQLGLSASQTLYSDRMLLLLSVAPVTHVAPVAPVYLACD